MKTIILFPSHYNDYNSVDYAYKNEFDVALTFSDFIPVLFNYDDFLNGNVLSLYPDIIGEFRCIYRGWMLNGTQYIGLYDELAKRNISLINSPDEYELCHVFPNVYGYIEGFTPESIWFDKNEKIDLNLVKSKFDKFMIKDYVKSVKGTSFPKYFTNEMTNDELSKHIDEFVKLRSKLYTGGILFKEYVDLKLYGGKTNEYRVYYYKSQIISVSRNSNQPGSCPAVTYDFVKKYNGIKSNFYTVDFAELSNGRWIIIEAGDGQVSGLSPNQHVFKFYEELSLNIKNQ